MILHVSREKYFEFNSFRLEARSGVTTCTDRQLPDAGQPKNEREDTI
jgi:hypothetical protein